MPPVTPARPPVRRRAAAPLPGALPLAAAAAGTPAAAAPAATTDARNAVVSQSGTDVTAKGAGWNGRIAPGATAGPGFRASFSGGGTAPGSFTLNGVPCA